MTSVPIEDHALLSDQRASALVTREGDIDWLCLPRFDSAALFCSLLGEDEHGHWSLRIADGEVVSRRYLPGTMVLETVWRSPTGTAAVTELMPIGDGGRPRGQGGEDPAGTAPTALPFGATSLVGDVDDQADLVRSVTCLEGEVHVVQQLAIRFDYGQTVPWVRRGDDAGGDKVLIAVAGGDGIALHGPALTAHGRMHRGEHRLRADETAAWVLTWFPSWQGVPGAVDVEDVLQRTVAEWTGWLGQIRVQEEYSQPVARSLLVLRALTHRRTGGIIAAATTSLPEDIGGVRNWDYRFCWLRDAALSLEALLAHGHVDAASTWRDWLLRAIAGDPERLQIMYSITGDRNLPERELAHLPGYADSVPVRVGNGAADQYQADVVGEVMIALGAMREAGLEESEWSWPLQRALVRYTEARIDQPDQGIWEMRGDPAFFTHGRVMVWATFDRAVHAVERHGLAAAPDELERWRRHRDQVREEVLSRGVGADGAFTQTYGSAEVDASLLQIPHTGFLPADDPRMLATVARIEQDLRTEEGLILRYRTQGQDGLPGDEHPFLVCCFWLVEQYAAAGRVDDAEKLLDQLLTCANDLDLLAEEYDGSAGRMIGNFPQAFSHLGLIRAVDALALARS
ncbi:MULTISPECIES: glycoside hydrolase family 15 protein [Brachybacterium]|uniref:glycoside hydrolase family 15 protein n=1 Tax=Brachybacterium TaxID=43668 RepID=UPI000BB750CA|nr:MULTISPECIES: glycoside hydrolase family 15 protein [Brachybacterium]PCC34320.1 glycoside hydrolase family 15 [Brachybacterium alimentarium]RCS61716.1 glycoside hydrolase family 15 protein [Brachybacterium sp. JB7]RCS64510.1 glycoside hydrolase family 15 protein [Brachybacterium alimentarium]RCS65970.1 glycoside hydrolase family 15 protein [Brachybacterium alimentarium]RCS75838.1 glycoside hydrolase family 15 protein [Brachybacterium alimentarium]